MGYLSSSTLLYGLVAILPVFSLSDFANPRAYDPSVCPKYGTTINASFPNVSNGRLKFPLRRPQPICRTFHSTRLETVLKEIKPKFKDPDLAVLFENAFTQTLDTTVRWYLPTIPLTAVTTGSFPEGWIKHAVHQLNVYLPLMKNDPELQNLILGFINFLSRYVTNEFTCPNSKTYEPVDEYFRNIENPQKHQPETNKCPLSLEDTAEFLSVSIGYHQSTGDTKFVTENWLKAVDQILSSYNRAEFGLLKDPMKTPDLRGVQWFSIPENAMVAVQVNRTSVFLAQVLNRSDLATRASQLSNQVRLAIETHGVIKHPMWGPIYAYEIDPRGLSNIMDDARVPSLLSMPYFGYTGLENSVYRATRNMALDLPGNPHYIRGKQGAGIGSFSTGHSNIWPMSLVSLIMSSESDYEILEILDILMKSTREQGLILETFDAHHPELFGKPWFGWANSYFSEAVLYLAEKKPYLILSDGMPFTVSSDGNLVSYGAMGQSSPRHGIRVVWISFCLVVLVIILHGRLRSRALWLFTLSWWTRCQTESGATVGYERLDSVEQVSNPTCG